MEFITPLQSVAITCYCFTVYLRFSAQDSRRQSSFGTHTFPGISYRAIGSNGLLTRLLPMLSSESVDFHTIVVLSDGSH